MKVATEVLSVGVNLAPVHVAPPSQDNRVLAGTGFWLARLAVSLTGSLRRDSRHCKIVTALAGLAASEW